MRSIGEPDDPLSKFSLGIFRLNGLLMRNGDRITKSIGQSSARWQVLGRLGYQSQTVANMARDMGHARQSVQRVADVLVQEGLAVYKDNPTDKRAQLLELTPTGAKALGAIYTAYEAWTEHIMTKLNPTLLAAAADALDSIGDVLEADDSAHTTDASATAEK